MIKDKNIRAKFDAAEKYMDERMRCKKRDDQANLVFLTTNDVDVTAWMCGWDAAMKYMESQK